jgi:RNA-directed DNA polymerase
MPQARKPGDLGGALPPMVDGRQPQEGDEPYDAERASQESDAAVVPEKSAKTQVTLVELMEGRAAAKGKSTEETAPPTQDGSQALSFLSRIGQRAKEEPKEQFTNLLSHIKVPLLTEAFRRLRKQAAPGVDGVRWGEYSERLGERLADLQDRIQRGGYHPQPVRRAHIPKGDGRTRPLGIPAIEDKVVQEAVRMLLEPIYEAEFLGFSYGFRLGRSQHDALDALATAIVRHKVNWVLDADIRSFFDTIDHGWMQRFLEHRIGDRRLVRLLMKMVRAGVMEDGELHDTERGAPQGGNVSPLLSNVYLHYVLDLWAQAWRRKQARGEMYVVRYADDFVMGFQFEEDAQAMRAALAERLAEFGLELHPDKTRMLEFGRFAREDRERRGLARPETFEFLGFVHIASVDRRGKFQLRRRTSRKKRRAKLARLREEIWRRRHAPVVEQHKWLSSVLGGHYRYYGVPTNHRAMRSFRREVEWTWHRALQRRSQRAHWDHARYQRHEQLFPLPPARILHPWPERRFALR